MRKNSEGIIFLVTLMMLVVFSLLIITGLQQTLLYYKAINRQEESHQHFYSLEHMADQLTRNAYYETDSTCLGKGSINEIELLKKLNNPLCSMKSDGLKYNYYIEDLGDFPCLVIIFDGLTFMSHHYQISIISEESAGHDGSLLQLRYFKRTGLSECSTTAHTVSEGISTWRYLSAQNLPGKEA